MSTKTFCDSCANEMTDLTTPQPRGQNNLDAGAVTFNALRFMFGARIVRPAGTPGLLVGVTNATTDICTVCIKAALQSVAAQA